MRRCARTEAGCSGKRPARPSTHSPPGGGGQDAGQGPGLHPAEAGEESGAETAVGAQDATRGHRPCRVTADGPAQGGFPSARVCPRVPGRQVRSESKILTGREGNQTENSAFSLHIYNIQVLTHYSKSGFSPWALRDGENSLGINAFSRILKSVRTGQVMLCPSGHKPERVLCPEQRDWRESARAHERERSQDRREGGGDGGVRGRRARRPAVSTRPCAPGSPKLSA